MRISATAAFTAAAVLLLAGCQTSLSEYSVNPYSFSGVRLYQVYCSSCHGLTGRGDGPVEPLLRGGVPDLTHMTQRHGRFPRDDVRDIIDGRENFLAHGTVRMPVWGFEFYSGNDPRSRERAEKMIDRLTDYLESLQVGAPR